MIGYVFGIFRVFSAISLQIFLEIHKVFLRKICFDLTENLSKSALADPIIVYMYGTFIVQDNARVCKGEGKKGLFFFY